MISLSINIKTYRQCSAVLLLLKMVSLYSIGLPILLALGFNGATALQPRFVGSTMASIRDHPYQLSIYFGENNVCGATIIAPTWAITAADCWASNMPSWVGLRAGSNETQVGGTFYHVSNFHIHPRYNNITQEFNVALLNVTKPFVYGKNVRSVPLPPVNGIVPTGANAVITGWGYVTNSGPAYSLTLRKLIMTVLSPTSCSSFYGKKFNANTMVCTRNVLNQTGLCWALGFPMVINGTLVGVDSADNGCTNSPPIFAKLSAPSIRNWISSVARI